jgi:hypothetical protein
MISRYSLIALMVAPLVLGGCLLPQPDTPPVPPFAHTGSKLPVGVTPALPQPDTPPVAPLKPNVGGQAAVPMTGTNGGKLLPQPDTPPIMTAQPQAAGANSTTGAPAGTSLGSGASAPMSSSANDSQNSAVPVSNGAGMAPTSSGAASAMPVVGPSPVPAGVLAGAFSGAAVSQVSATDESGATTFQTAAVGSDGSFSFKLVPGRYQLVVTLSGRKLRLGDVFVVDSAVTRNFSIKLRETPPGATVSEDVALADPAATGM